MGRPSVYCTVCGGRVETRRLDGKLIPERVCTECEAVQ